MDFSPAWRTIVHTAHAEFRAPTFADAGRLIGAIAAAADVADHHPEVSLRYPGIVRVALSSHDAGGLTGRDERLARTIDQLAEEHRAEPLTVSTQVVTIAIDTMDADRILPFWKAAFAYRDAGGALVDPAGVGPAIWFQQMDEPRPQRNRVHLDVYVSADQAEARVAAVVAAGGTLVTDRFAPSWWVMADADGNEACICTSMQAPDRAETNI
ncbi:MAG: VOC family protein [Ilumatobacteraceae bacterium]|jgi:4a-hydroxytetrahydrobiopterin dehydratase